MNHHKMATHHVLRLKEKTMMRKLLTAVFFVLLSLSVSPAQAYAAVNNAQDEVLLVQKKKKLAALKAAEEKKKAAHAAEVAKFKAARQKAAKLRAEKLKTMRTAARRDCGGFMQCLFGKSRRSSSGGSMSHRSMRKQVAWNETKYAPGTLIVRTPERALYYVLGDGEAMRYSIGVGREGFQWSGNSRIVAKAEWPSWTPPQTMIKREAAKGHIIPPFMKGGPGNPLGARAMYIGGTIYRVHGTNSESSIGGAVSSGCIRMMNADVIDLYGRVKVGSPIYVYQ
jgi:lipoprotein-anchoring transpeptidase ErfK/SrfK